MTCTLNLKLTTEFDRIKLFLWDMLRYVMIILFPWKLAYYSNYNLSPDFYIKLQSTKVSIKVFESDK